MAYHILSARRHQIWVITCLSHTQHEGVVVRLGAAAPSIALAARCGGAVCCTCAAVNCTHGSVRRCSLLHSRRRQSQSRLGAAAPSIALAPPPPTHLFLSLGKMFQWRKSLVCCFGALAPPSIALAPTLPPKICKSDSTKQSLNNF